MGRSLPLPQNCPFAWGNVDLHLIVRGFLGPPESTLKRHLDRFKFSTVFAGLTIVTDRQTNRPTDPPTDRSRYSVCNSRPKRSHDTTIYSLIKNSRDATGYKLNYKRNLTGKRYKLGD